MNIGWNEAAVGKALSLMGLTSLICQTFAGDIIDRTTFCALDSSNTLNCWGRNEYGQLGDGTTTYKSAPTTISQI